MNVELLRKLRKRPVAFDGRSRYFRFESRCVVPARLCFMVSPDSPGTSEEKRRSFCDCRLPSGGTRRYAGAAVDSSSARGSGVACCL
jgi:hypothetical protein